MSNHARGLWGYSGRTASGLELTIQATGMGGPSAAVVLTDLAKLGVRRAVRVGTCTGFPGLAQLGELLLPAGVVAAAGSATAFGLEPGARLSADQPLYERLAAELAGEGRDAPVASLDTLHGDPDSTPGGVVAVDMQTVAVFARAAELGIASAAVLIVSKVGEERLLGDEALEQASIQAGRAAAQTLSNLRV
jgi:uridine phosphorylase